jgi:hypothetical protein
MRRRSFFLMMRRRSFFLIENGELKGTYCISTLNIKTM